MTQEITESKDETPKPVFGASGRQIVYDKDGKPCRTCNTLLDFQMVSGKSKVPSKTEEKIKKTENPASTYKQDDPPDVEKLGRSSWTLLHLIAATYPEHPTTKEQADMKQFVKLFGNFYPCWFCADDFKKYMVSNEPETETQDSLGKWLCGAHNEVNKKLGKPQFDCTLWKKRWKDGWD
ncbi:putative mitochondrial FAD-linked sulfhydryl oxidase [Metschnikowia bicuspidata var. bicuspidata NRRL YB-4993]|uniref:Sulfhydryl oxidase n=1 Tax=Metschnikowia bicuspidata var. bicuspidata NRRL YB-4993 TaxID=869754 RepID=A0A1A0HH57_9ASCO|nr:putative mitochondrial FAD-linked sulfhydryl oxidase [Metschnikowia bicuspidata var. bicuspidata NRRL YB-4993]OBA23330.1 putative mitochondrial FAD-linked sulfhydryl oxidase [Metschnikowia bicuspidata var. bicuspidata NRRL YB-4993]